MPFNPLALGDGTLVAFVANWVVHSPWFPQITPEQNTKIKVLVACLSAITTVLSAWGAGQLEGNMLVVLCTSVYAVLQTMGISALVHHWIIKPEKQAQVENQ